MRIWINTRVEIDFDGRVVAKEGFWYDGPVAECKKGRDQVENASNQSGQIGTENRGIQSDARGAIDPFAKSLIAKPGQLSPYAAAQYESDKRNIAKTAQDATAVGEKTLAFRNMGGSPTALSSIANTSNDRAAHLDADAYATAGNRTLQGGLEGVRSLQGQEQIFDPLRAFGQQGDLGFKRSQMGSTLGDIGAGLGQVGQMAAGFA